MLFQELKEHYGCGVVLYMVNLALGGRGRGIKEQSQVHNKFKTDFLEALAQKGKQQKKEKGPR